MAATETLLVVENETAIRALVKMALERHGYTVLSAESGNEALSLAADNQGPIDLLITDVVMPDLRGPDQLLGPDLSGGPGGSSSHDPG